MKYEITNQRDLRKAFWQSGTVSPSQSKDAALRYLHKGEYPTDIRVAWCDWIDHMARSHAISEALAQRATL